MEKRGQDLDGVREGVLLAYVSDLREPRVLDAVVKDI